MWAAANQGFKQAPSIPVVAASYLLDTISTTVQGAYSLRQLRAAYAGSALRVRRSSDNTEQDIGFVSGALDTVSLLTFCGTSGSSNGFVSKLYDQSGLGQDMTQVTAANQPTIVLAGVVTVLANATAMAAMSFPPPSSYNLSNASFIMSTTTAYASATIASRASTGPLYGRLLDYIGAGTSGEIASGSAIVAYYDGNNIRVYNTGSNPAASLPTTDPFQSVTYFNGTSGTTVSVNSTVSSSSVTASAPIYSGFMGICSNTSGSYFSGMVSEVLIFSGNFSSADQSTVKSNQKTYYGTP